MSEYSEKTWCHEMLEVRVNGGVGKTAASQESGSSLFEEAVVISLKSRFMRKSRLRPLTGHLTKAVRRPSRVLGGHFPRSKILQAAKLWVKPLALLRLNVVRGCQKLSPSCQHHQHWSNKRGEPNMTLCDLESSGCVPA